MKQLPDLKIPEIIHKQFQCGFCKKILVHEKRMIKHEDICYYNPNRNCGELGCANTGLDSNGLPCHYCEVAKKVGGKSYLKNL